MSIRIQLISILIGFAFLFFVVRYIRKNSFSPNYSILWIIVSVFLISIPILEPFYKWLSVSVIGITDARHIIYIFLIGFLLIFNLFLTSKITQLTNQVKRMISFSAILEKEIREMRRI